MTLTFEEIQAWTAEEARERLASSDENVAEILRISAEAGVSEAQALYGQVLLDGKGVSQDQAEALRWFSKAAQAGHAMAMNMVGRCCEHGWGTRIDKALAAKWYDAAATKGLDWGMYNLATLHCLGEGVALDRAEALRLFEAAAALGHVKSVNMIGGFHEDGWVVDRDMTVAAQHYLCAAEGGDFRGMFNHARMLIDRDEVDEAARWLRKLPSCATASFIAKTAAWLKARPEPALHEIAAELSGI